MREARFSSARRHSWASHKDAATSSSQPPRSSHIASRHWLTGTLSEARGKRVAKHVSLRDTQNIYHKCISGVHSWAGFSRRPLRATVIQTWAIIWTWGRFCIHSYRRYVEIGNRSVVNYVGLQLHKVFTWIYSSIANVSRVININVLIKNYTFPHVIRSQTSKHVQIIISWTI